MLRTEQACMRTAVPVEGDHHCGVFLSAPRGATEDAVELDAEGGTGYNAVNHRLPIPRAGRDTLPARGIRPMMSVAIHRGGHAPPVAESPLMTPEP